MNQNQGQVQTLRLFTLYQLALCRIETGFREEEGGEEEKEEDEQGEEEEEEEQGEEEEEDTEAQIHTCHR